MNREPGSRDGPGWRSGAVRGCCLARFTSPCGCDVRVCDTRDGRIVHYITAKGAHCATASHEPGCAIAVPFRGHPFTPKEDTSIDAIENDITAAWTSRR